MLTSPSKVQLTFFTCDKFGVELASNLEISRTVDPTGEHLCGTMIDETGPIEVDGKVYEPGQKSEYRLFNHCDKKATRSYCVDLMSRPKAKE